MATIAQINANIGNAHLSTGPRTPEGKQASSRNSLRHGLFASLEALRPDDRRRVEEILDHFSAEFPFADAASQRLLHDLALAWFRRDRIRAMQEAFFDTQLQLARQSHPDETTNLTDHHLLAGILLGDADSKCILDKLHRWDRAYSRDIDRALKSLKELSQPLESEIDETNPIPAPPPPEPSLNGPCPCGSGRKYKRCCRPFPAKPVSAAHATQ